MQGSKGSRLGVCAAYIWIVRIHYSYPQANWNCLQATKQAAIEVLAQGVAFDHRIFTSGPLRFGTSKPTCFSWPKGEQAAQARVAVYMDIRDCKKNMGLWASLCHRGDLRGIRVTLFETLA